MSNINFDDFEREIRQAESYLNSASAKDQDVPINTAEKHQDTIFFASDLQSEPYGYQDEILNFRSSSMDVPSSSARAADPMMDTIRFGGGNDSAHGYDEDLFYASDVLATGSRRYGTEEEEEMLSFLPSPRPTQTQSLDHLNTSQLSASLADTVRFTKPVEPALRSMDNTYTTERAVPQTSSNTTGGRSASAGRSRPTNATTSNTTNNNTSTLNTTTNSYTSYTSGARRNASNTSPPPAKFVRQTYVPETFGPRRTANAISMERIEELHRKRLAAKQDLLKKKRALDELQLAECTFQPQISRGTRAILHQKQQFEQLEADCHRANTNNGGLDENDNNNNNTPQEVSERLYREASIRTAQQHWINVQVQHLRDSQYTFQPSMHTHANANNNNTSSTSNVVHRSGSVEARAAFALDRRPIHERISDMMKEKKQYLLALKTSIEEEQVDLTFQPRIDARSRAIAEQKLTGYGANHNLPRGGSRSPTRNRPTSGSGGAAGGLSGEQQMALVMGFHGDVGSRLIDQGRAMAKRKQQLAHERDNALAAAMEQVAISKGSAKIVQKADLKE